MNTISLLVALTVNAAPATIPTSEQFLADIQSAQHKGDFQRATELADACVTARPSELPCLREGGLLWWRFANEKNDAAAHQKAATYFKRYVELAPAGDSFSKKAKTLLTQSK